MLMDELGNKYVCTTEGGKVWVANWETDPIQLVSFPDDLPLVEAVAFVRDSEAGKYQGIQGTLA